jgi:hypothetical protein
MMHPQHGWTHAYDNGEIEKLKGLGWVVEGAEVPVINNHEEPVVLPVLDEPPKRKPGRPPKAK